MQDPTEAFCVLVGLAAGVWKRCRRLMLGSTAQLSESLSPLQQQLLDLVRTSTDPAFSSYVYEHRLGRDFPCGVLVA
jgi:hypothetical protein